MYSTARFMLTTFPWNSNGIFSFGVQTSEASVVAVGASVSVFARKVHLRNDVLDDALVFQNALVSQQHKSAGFQIEHYPAPRRFLILHVRGRDSLPLELLPYFVVPVRIGQIVTIRLCTAQGNAINYQCFPDDPENTYVWFSLGIRLLHDKLRSASSGIGNGCVT
jgi:hypothetical protein